MTATQFAPGDGWHARRCALSVIVPAILCVCPPALGAQRVATRPVPSLTGEAQERARLRQVLGSATGAAGSWTLIRSASRILTPSRGADSAPGWQIGLVAPELRTVNNSGLPFSLNQGSMWAGRGLNTSITGGVFALAGPFSLVVAPTHTTSENRIFQVIPYPQVLSGSRNVWANPFHPLPESIDLPLRFGEQRLRRGDPGQSSLTVNVGAVAAGVATENLWWGPGLRNAITLSNNAAGFPHAFLETRGPITTRAGMFDAQWILGELRESDFFDSDASNDKRSLAGIVATWHLAGDSALTLGFSRLVMSQVDGSIGAGAAFDVLRTVGHANTDTINPPPSPGRDQIFSFFARWVLPRAGFEAWAEWARFEEPISPRDFLEFPGHSEGYTLGFQWAKPIATRTFRIESEASYLEPDPSLRLRPVRTSYTSRGVPQGFTHRGKTLGAAIGPGSSSQWLAGDYFTPAWRLGTYLSRIRWDNGVLFEPLVPQFKRQDVTLLAGLRASANWRGTTLLVDFAHAARFDYLYQAYVLGPLKTGGVDLLNNTLSVTLSTDLRRK